MDTRAAAEAAGLIIRERAGRTPSVGLICGTGFARTDILEDAVTIPFEELGFRDSAIPGHVNEVVVGEVAGVTVAATQGKVLPCDGATMAESGMPARSLAMAGCHSLLYSASSGSMRDDVLPGAFLAFTDHIDFCGQDPWLASARAMAGRRPTSRKALYDAVLTERVRAAARRWRAALPPRRRVLDGADLRDACRDPPRAVGGLLHLLELVPARGDRRVPCRHARGRLHLRVDDVSWPGAAHRVDSGARPRAAGA